MRQPANSTVPVVDARPDGGHVGYGRNDPHRASPADAAAPGANLPATVQYGGQAQTVHEVAGVAWSYSAAPTGGNLQVLDGPGGLVLNLDVTAAGPGFLPFDPPLQGSPGRTLTLTLAAGGGTVAGKLSVLGHRAVQLPTAPGPVLDFSQAADSQFLPLV